MSLYSLFQRGGFAREKLQPRSAEAVSNAERFRPGLPLYRGTPSDNFPSLPLYRGTPSDNFPDYFDVLPYTPRGNVTDLSSFISEAPNMQNEIFGYGNNLGNEGIFNEVNRRMQGNPVLRKAKNVYDWVDKNPWVPNVDIGDKQLGYDFDQPLMGGDISYGFDYDLDDEGTSAYLNWGKTY